MMGDIFLQLRKLHVPSDDAWENRPRSKERRKIAKGAIKWAQGMAPEYDNMFKPGPDITGKRFICRKNYS